MCKFRRVCKKRPRILAACLGQLDPRESIQFGEMSHVYSPKNFLIQSAPGTEIPGMQNPSKWPAVHSTETQGNAF